MAAMPVALHRFLIGFGHIARRVVFARPGKGHFQGCLKYCNHQSMKISMFRVAIFIACAWCAPAQSAVVRLNIVATDKQGQPVTDLKTEDLRVTDEGKPQRLVMFRVNDARHPAPAALGPHEYANRTPGIQPGATIVVFDLLNGAFADRGFTELTLVKALENVEKPENVFLYILTNDGTLYPLHALPKQGAMAPAPDPHWNSQTKPLLDAAMQKFYGFKPPENRGAAIFKVLDDLGGELAALPGRKNVVWITSGFPLLVDFRVLCPNMMVSKGTDPCTGKFVVRYLAVRLDAVGVSMYPVYDRMLTNETLDTFVDMTAGRTYAGDVKAAIPDALQAMLFSYTAAYLPAPKSWDGKFHNIRLTTARKGIQLQSERGYIATPRVEDTAALLQAAAASSSDISAIGLRATATPGASPHTIHVQLRIDPSNLTIVQQNGRYAGQLAMLYAGVATDGVAQLAKPSNIKLDWTVQQYDSATKAGIEVAQDLPIPEGVRQVRIAVVDASSKQVGTLTVPVS
jgi:VWFA-related protein